MYLKMKEFRGAPFGESRWRNPNSVRQEFSQAPRPVHSWGLHEWRTSRMTFLPTTPTWISNGQRKPAEAQPSRGDFNLDPFVRLMLGSRVGIHSDVRSIRFAGINCTLFSVSAEFNGSLKYYWSVPWLKLRLTIMGCQRIMQFYDACRSALPPPGKYLSKTFREHFSSN